MRLDMLRHTRLHCVADGDCIKHHVFNPLPAQCLLHPGSQTSGQLKFNGTRQHKYVTPCQMP